MPFEIRPFSAEWRPAVRDFNARLDAAGAAAGMRLPDDPCAEMLTGSETYLAVEDGMVRGGYTLRPQPFWLLGQTRCVAHLRLPVSEGIVDRRYAMLGSLLVRSALQKEPRLFALGMGGMEQRLPRMLAAMGWHLAPIPFCFRVVHAGRFLRGMRAARPTPLRRGLMDLAAVSGIASIGIHAVQTCRTRRAAPVRFQEVADFDGFTDAVWEGAHRSYNMVAVRNSEALRRLYPPSNTRFLRIQTTAGWAVLLDTAMRGDQYFGDLRVGTIVDCLAKPEDAAAVIHAARAFLVERGVDLIISNQGHSAWTKALGADGFFQAPSNFLFARSPEICALGASEWHINRGDGDGPVHL